MFFRELVEDHILRIAQLGRGGLPGFSGRLQGTYEAGWQPLSHAGAIEGIVLADYKATPQYGTQAGAMPILIQAYDVTSMSR